MYAQGKPLKELQDMSEEELIEIHDRLMNGRVINDTEYIVRELNRRYQKRQTDRMLCFTIVITACTVLVTIATVFNVVLTVMILACM